MPDVICLYCGNEFYRSSGDVLRGRDMYCSRECSNKAHQVRVSVSCLHCGIIFNVTKSRIDDGRGKYCSRRCYSSSQRLNVQEKNPNWNGGLIENVCLVCGEKYVTKLCYKNTTKFCSYKCSHKYKSMNNIGSGNPNWRGGLTQLNYDGRHQKEYLIWRKSVYERDKYRCQHCGDNSGHNLNAHHIIPYSIDESLRLDIANGITLCEECHKNEHTRLKKIRSI